MATAPAGAGNTAVLLGEDSKRAVITFAKRAMELMHSQYSVRPGLENVDKYYQMEGNQGQEDLDARIMNRLGDKSRYRDVVVPVVMPQVESALGYYMTIFLGGHPIFPVNSPAGQEDAAMQLNSIFAQHEKKAKWARELIMFWRDGLKYNLHGIEVDWRQQASYAVTNDNTQQEGKPKQILWQGNVLERMDLYNTFFDPRVPPALVHEEGEFAGYTKLYSKIKMKKFINELYGKIPAQVAIDAFNSGFSGVTPGSSYIGFYVPQINPEAIKSSITGQFDWSMWLEGGNGLSNRVDSTIIYKNMYQVTKLYARIIPSEFGIKVPGANTPQVWKFYVVNNEVLLYAERMTNAHNYIPIIFGQPIEDGLNYQTKSFAQNVMPLQDTSSTFWNAAIASKRRLTHDRTFYDPSRIRASDINNPNPSAKIPVRPSAYGKNPGEAVYVAPYRDELSAALVQESEMLRKFADFTNGQNAATQGQFTKGNRTLHEYQDVVGHSNTRNQTLCVMTETQVHTPMKEILLLNTLQYPSQTDLTTPDGTSTIKVDITKLRAAVINFDVADGLEPVDKDMNTDEFAVALQTLQAVPSIGSSYDVGDIFAYMMDLRGADLSAFKKTDVEIQYDQQLQAWQQAAQQAAMKGTAFSSPMPQPPSQQQIQQAKQAAAQQQSMSVAQLVQAAGGAPSGDPNAPSPQQQMAAAMGQDGGQGAPAGAAPSSQQSAPQGGQ